MEAEFVYKTYLLMMIVLQAYLITWDVYLLCTGQQTVSEWLRLHPLWYRYSVAIAAGILALITIHLFDDKRH